MLVLSRKRGEEILIGDDIRVTVTWIGENSVKLGITAPRGVVVMRQEVMDRIARKEPRNGLSAGMPATEGQFDAGSDLDAA